MNPNKLYLTQTDTTVGFVSCDAKKLSKAKNRDINQPFLICVDSLKKLKKLTRVPKTHRKRVRKSTKTSFLYPNKKAIRVVNDPSHAKFLKEFDFMYSTSANKNKESFELKYALTQVDIVIEDTRGFFETEASTIFRLGKKHLHKLR
jgi:tRNA A37 threonylcarbamoyladenosine synthetase subunit TsaC/SUA5/YrdC